MGTQEPDPRIRLDPSIDPRDAARGRAHYDGSTAQPRDYGNSVPREAQFVRDLVASVAPGSVFEFGCNAGRNLDLLRAALPGARLVGCDVNGDALREGRARWPSLDLRQGGEELLRDFADREFDIVLTVSVLGHLPEPRGVARELLRICRGYVVIGELAGLPTGRIAAMTDSDGRLVAAPPYCYFHDYRRIFADELGAVTVLDQHCPVGRGNLLEFYRLFVFAREVPIGVPLVAAVRLRTLSEVAQEDTALRS